MLRFLHISCSVEQNKERMKVCKYFSGNHEMCALRVHPNYSTTCTHVQRRQGLLAFDYCIHPPPPPTHTHCSCAKVTQHSVSIILLLHVHVIMHVCMCIHCFCAMVPGLRESDHSPLGFMQVAAWRTAEVSPQNFL